MFDKAWFKIFDARETIIYTYIYFFPFYWFEKKNRKKPIPDWIGGLKKVTCGTEVIRKHCKIRVFIL